MKKLIALAAMLLIVGSYVQAQITATQKSPTAYVNPLLGTATLWDPKDLGFVPTHRSWGAEVFPGSSLPNAMVQLTPVSQFHSGSGYQYEDTVIYGFAHTSKGHWNLANIPLMPATGSNFTADDYKSAFSHKNETAHPGYYQVYLPRYGVNAELTSTLRCAFHKYTFKPGADKKLIADLSMANERIRSWDIEKTGDNVLTGFQQGGEKMYFYAVTSHKILRIDTLNSATNPMGRPAGARAKNLAPPGPKKTPVVSFADGPGPLELRIGFSYVSVKNAKENLEKEMLGKSFAQVRQEATQTWNNLLGKIQVTGGTDRQKGLFYSCLYRSFLWPALRSDVNGDFTDMAGNVVNKGFNYYTEPSIWDDYRNKDVLLGLLSPKVMNDVIQSLVDKGKIAGFMPTFFHGDHASAIVTGSYLRGLKDYDVKGAYALMLKNATVEGTRKYVDEYNTKGYIAEAEVEHPVVNTVRKAAVTKTLEYAYDDYAVAQLAKKLGDTQNYTMLMKRTGNYKNVFNPQTGFMEGRLADGSWVKNFDPNYVYYEYMYREANAWQSTFFAPQDPQGLISLFPNKAAAEKKLDDMFGTPYNGLEADNMSGFIGQYCQGNQPDHSTPYYYYFVGKQQKAQVILDSIMNHYYDMGKDKLAYAGMDDAGEMSSWFVFNAMGIYTFSPADPKYIVSVPLFAKITLNLGDRTATILRKNHGKKITSITIDDKKINDYFVEDADLKKGKTLVITTN
ncbi:GH92 family glycosyl hydrolase [Mucilaginibacter sp. UR6-11]|uniref:GH92 family glycosyl hydrolase n=1 Tax=Mucilaginibacter sp. UR6-11 TaxID=1435644 RepID=UPI001E2F3BEE|nr:GH92 family glycosyl hydrolase [Mucilaginibacter sp. UR6-11]MCC8423720.1 GH92 family glycosyl hydrolase [Mucilaginibacter sp. UR6-11]